MSDKRISELVELTSLAADDELVVVDADANGTKRVTYDTLATEVRTESEALTGTTATFSGDVTAQANLDVDGDLAFDSGFGSTGTAYGVRAWVYFNGDTGNIFNSANVSSVSRLATGRYQINFSDNMPDSNYAVLANFGDVTVGFGNQYVVTVERDSLTTGYFRLVGLDDTVADADRDEVFAAVIR